MRMKPKHAVGLLIPATCVSLLVLLNMNRPTVNPQPDPAAMEKQGVETFPPADIHVPPEPDLGIAAKDLESQVGTIADGQSPAPIINPLLPLVDQWDAFVQGKPTREHIREFFQQLDVPEIFEVMEHVCQSTPELASAMFAYDIIPILKHRWSTDGGRWEDNAPYGWLLALSSDTEKPALFRMVMIDVLGTGSRKAADASIRKRMANGLAAMAGNPKDAEEVRTYAVNKLGIITPPGETSPHAAFLRSCAKDENESGLVRGASITALSRIDDETAIPIIQNICDQYRPESNAAVARAAVVALGDFARSHQVPAFGHIRTVLSTTADRDVHASAMHAMSLLDDAQFAEALPEIMSTSDRFGRDGHTRNSLTAVLWAHPDAVIAALNSDDDAVVRAAIRAATIVPLPPAKVRLQHLLNARSPEEHETIRYALEKADDTKAYEVILRINIKAREEE